MCNSHLTCLTCHVPQWFQVSDKASFCIWSISQHHSALQSELCCHPVLLRSSHLVMAEPCGYCVDLRSGKWCAMCAGCFDSSAILSRILTRPGKVQKGLQEAKGIKSGSSGPLLATQTTAKPVGSHHVLFPGCKQLQHHSGAIFHGLALRFWQY